MPREFAMRTIWFTLAVSTLAVSCTVPNAALNPSVSSAPSSTSWLDDQPINPVPPYVAGAQIDAARHRACNQTPGPSRKLSRRRQSVPSAGAFHV